MQLSSNDIREIKDEIRNASYRTAGAITGAALVVGAAVIKALDGYAPTMLVGAPLLSWLLGIWGALLLYISLGR
jgi:ubiquinone biosynthesis protein